MSHRLTIRIEDEDFEAMERYCKKTGIAMNDFIREAAAFKIAWTQKDYDLAPLEVQRLNQLIEIITSLSYNVKSLEGVVTSGFDSLLGLTRGDNYLLDEEDGEL